MQRVAKGMQETVKVRVKGTSGPDRKPGKKLKNILVGCAYPHQRFSVLNDMNLKK